MDITICNGLGDGDAAAHSPASYPTVPIERELFANLHVGLMQVERPTVLDALTLLQDLITTYLQEGPDGATEDVLMYWFGVVDGWIEARRG